jgi:plastocyanin
MSRLLRFALVVGALAAMTVACSPSAGGSPAASAGPADLSISAKDLVFNPSAADVPAGRPFTIAFDNQESAPHNIQIARDPSFAANQILFTGEVVSSQKVNYSVPALAAGTYPFRCEVHPNMLGTFTAK